MGVFWRSVGVFLTWECKTQREVTLCVLEGNSGCGPVGITKYDLRSVGVVLLWCGD